jgi:ketosteroid isomerase-like protein
MTSAVELVEGLYARWNEGGLAEAEEVDPAVELLQDPLVPNAATLHGVEGWRRWAARWEESFASLRLTPDAIVRIDAEHVLALVSITATPAGAAQPLTWAAAHVWTVRAGRIAGWRAHLDLAAVRATLDAPGG